MGVCNFSMFCCMLLYVLSSFVIILFGKREPVALLGLSSLCLVIVVAVPWVCLQFVYGKARNAYENGYTSMRRVNCSILDVGTVWRSWG